MMQEDKQNYERRISLRIDGRQYEQLAELALDLDVDLSHLLREIITIGIHVERYAFNYKHAEHLIAYLLSLPADEEGNHDRN